MRSHRCQRSPGDLHPSLPLSGSPVTARAPAASYRRTRDRQPRQHLQRDRDRPGRRRLDPGRDRATRSPGSADDYERAGRGRDAAAARLPAVPQQPAAAPDQGPAPRRPRGRSSCGRRSSGSATSTPLEADLTIQHRGEPVGERMVVTGRVLDGDGRPVRHQLVEIWQANAAGRYIHKRDQHPAPIDPNFTGVGRCLTDGDGTYRVHHDQARALPVEEPPQRLAAGAHPLLAVRHRVHPADDHPDVLPGRPAVRARPDLPVDRRPAGARAAGRDVRPRRDPARVGHRLPLGHRAHRHAPHAAGGGGRTS